MAGRGAGVAGDEWNTPRHIIDALGPFDLDPATPPQQPWPTARRRFTRADDGLLQQWRGFVWLNPPYSDVRPWLAKLAEHGAGIALVPASTGCRAWAASVYPAAAGVAFHIARIKFCDARGSSAKYNAGFYSAFVAYGAEAAERLRTAIAAGKLRAHYVPLRPE
jgi:hypothetical protein